MQMVSWTFRRKEKTSWLYDFCSSFVRVTDIFRESKGRFFFSWLSKEITEQFHLMRVIVLLGWQKTNKILKNIETFDKRCVF